MPTYMPRDTREAFEQNAEKFDSRSLLLDRFVYDHPEMDEARRLHFSRACEDSFRFVQAIRAKWQKDCDESRNDAQRRKLQAYLDDTAALARQIMVAGPAEPRKEIESKWAFLNVVAAKKILHAQLQSRLMVNMAGGVMENAGLCLDRFGLPYIPGSAVKGCARHTALAALREWCETDAKPTASDNPLAPCCDNFTTPADFLTAIARVFGWCEQDWSLKQKDGRYISDFAWACRNKPHDIWKQVAEKLCADFGWKVPKEKQEHPWDALPNYAGSVSFLAAYPVDLKKTGKVDGLPREVPAIGKLELDVVTCHHREYYYEPDRAKNQQHWEEWNRKWSSAPDVEDPVPVVFPAVAPGHVFAFALAPLRGANDTIVQHALTWLATGLSVFGIGAKTASGYGWFDSSDAVHRAVTELLRRKAESEKKNAEEKIAKEKAEAEAKAKAAEKAALAAALAKLSGDERADKEIELLTDQQFDAKVRAFCREPKRGGPTEEQKKAIVRALRGPRLAYWQAFKTKATKGDLAAVDQAIRQLSKAMNLGKMP